LVLKQKKYPMVLIVLSLFLGTLVTAAIPSAKAASVTIHLYGNAATGWGTSPGGETMPGPTLTVNKDDVVTLMLHSEDGLPHKFLLDYNGNGIPDAGEPTSPIFTSMTTIVFTASLAGTFTYLCTIHPVTMFGTWVTVAPPPPTVHDVAVTAVSASPLTVTIGDTVTISVTVKNVGTASDAPAVQAFAGSILVGTQNVTLQPSQTATLAFSWVTTGVVPSSYLISAKALPVTDETNLANNQMNDGTVTVNLPPPGTLKAELAGHKAWPDFHHLAIHHVGSTQTFYGKIANIGTGPVKAKVVFSIYTAAGSFVATVESGVATIPLGGIAVVSGTWTAVPGSYAVKAQCWYDSNNDTYFDGSDPAIKTFTFKVVP